MKQGGEANWPWPFSSSSPILLLLIGRLLVKHTSLTSIKFAQSWQLAAGKVLMCQPRSLPFIYTNTRRLRRKPFGSMWMRKRSGQGPRARACRVRSSEAKAHRAEPGADDGRNCCGSHRARRSGRQPKRSRGWARLTSSSRIPSGFLIKWCSGPDSDIQALAHTTPKRITKMCCHRLGKRGRAFRQLPDYCRLPLDILPS